MKATNTSKIGMGLNTNINSESDLKLPISILRYEGVDNLDILYFQYFLSILYQLMYLNGLITSRQNIKYNGMVTGVETTNKIFKVIYIALDFYGIFEVKTVLIITNSILYKLIQEDIIFFVDQIIIKNVYKYEYKIIQNIQNTIISQK
ncbi:Hypothetical_protein [Hexamita inflata]|uniref:Hypothetical_protein n=1 Tax=Hexamita inflata TaxID=28002 RepID=A0ABP1GWF1_9EUKA